MLVLNDTGKIGIDKLISVLGYADNYKEVVNIKGYNPYYCKKLKCNMCTQLEGQAIPEEQKEKIKEFFCSDCPYAAEKFTIYHNERNNYKAEELILSKSRLLQYILLHFVCDSNGFIKNISCKDIAKKLNITIRTVKDNIKFFLDKNFICATKRNSDQVGLFIVGYKDYFKTKEDYGRGYLEITKEIFEKIKDEKNINAIRLVFRQLIQYSKTNRIFDDEIREAEYTYKEIKRFLPNYINCPKKINTLIKNSEIDIFITKLNNDGINFQFKYNYDNEYIRKNNYEKYKVKIQTHIFKQGRILGNKLINERVNLLEITDIEIYINDFIQMAQQYNLELVLIGLDYLIELILKQDYIGNYGGVVRNKIKEIIYGKAAAM